MGGQYYKITSFKGSTHYDRWSKNIQRILTLDHCWLVTIREEITPKVPQALSKKKPASVAGDRMLVKAVVNTDSAKKLYEAKMEKYREKLFDCNDK